ncbi:hypothetical protein Sf12_gp72 [Shigella phage Sf12]|uniref:Uncharacterized protein n=1 Tax=Shigella phage Sf12 TaxID=2024315 RepID=A0A291AXS7_9CAUD|nr:hypothetical protein HOR99_gp68 [Shigella phage Sf12]ATE85798.1 hypothetical protein Sf12_gp72 [Shigella phage Sf12]
MINIVGYLFIVKKDNHAIKCFIDEDKASEYANSIGGFVDIIALDQ